MTWPVYDLNPAKRRNTGNAEAEAELLCVRCMNDGAGQELCVYPQGSVRQPEFAGSLSTPQHSGYAASEWPVQHRCLLHPVVGENP